MEDTEKDNYEPFKFYECDEIKNILINKERLVYADDGSSELIIKYTDIPDFIVDVNRRMGICDLNFYEYNGATMTPIVSTYGKFLNKCDLKVREDIIDRLVRLQTNEESLKDYKVMDEYTILTAKEEMKKNKKEKNKER